MCVEWHRSGARLPWALKSVSDHKSTNHSESLCVDQTRKHHQFKHPPTPACHAHHGCWLAILQSSFLTTSLSGKFWWGAKCLIKGEMKLYKSGHDSFHALLQSLYHLPRNVPGSDWQRCLVCSEKLNQATKCQVCCLLSNDHVQL